MRLLIIDPTTDRWQVPNDLRPPHPIADSESVANAICEFQEKFDENGWGFIMRRTDTNAKVFETSDIGSLIFRDQFIQLNSTLLPNHHLYGLGQRDAPLRLVSGVYTMWNADNGTQPQMNMYGSHPAYWSIEDDGNAHAVILYNSNQMDVILDDKFIAFKTVGGILDFTFVFGPTPAEVAAQYTDLLDGRSCRQPGRSDSTHRSGASKTSK